MSYDDALKSKPVGTGPFIFESYAPNESFVANRNPDYWNQPYPYLDRVEFRPIPDALNRRDALRRRSRAQIEVLEQLQIEAAAEVFGGQSEPV